MGFGVTNHLAQTATRVSRAEGHNFPGLGLGELGS
jgi:hypothetical protein